MQCILFGFGCACNLQTVFDLTRPDGWMNGSKWTAAGVGGSRKNRDFGELYSPNSITVCSEIEKTNE
jgi:hypothetical protein